MNVSPLAGKPAEPSMLIDVPEAGERLLYGRDPIHPCPRSAWYSAPPAIAAARSTTPSTRRTSSPSPRRSASTASSRASTARCTSASIRTRSRNRLSTSALEVLAGNGVDVMVDADNGYTPTPVISHAILIYNRGRQRGLADGIVITPSHNPPDSAASSTTRPMAVPLTRT